MDRLSIASTWLLTTASALSPLIALLIGFAGTDRLLRWQSAGNAVASPTPEAGEISRRSAKALQLSIPRSGQAGSPSPKGTDQRRERF